MALSKEIRSVVNAIKVVVVTFIYIVLATTSWEFASSYDQYVGSSSGYRADNSPSNVVYNYITALETEDYARAYFYLDPTLPAYPPTLEAFIASVTTHNFTVLDRNEYQLVAEKIEDDGRVRVEIKEHLRTEGNLLKRIGFHYALGNYFYLRPTDDGWKLNEGLTLFSACWVNPDYLRSCHP